MKVQDPSSAPWRELQQLLAAWNPRRYAGRRSGVADANRQGR